MITDDGGSLCTKIDDKVWACQVCGKTFKSGSNVKRHIREIHMKMKRPERSFVV